MYSEDKLDYLLKIYNERSVADYKKVGAEIGNILGTHYEYLKGRLGECALNCEFKKEDSMKINPELREKLAALDIEETRLLEICKSELKENPKSEKENKPQVKKSTGTGAEKIKVAKTVDIPSKKSIPVVEKKENKWETTKPMEPLFAKPDTKSTKDHTRVASVVTNATNMTKNSTAKNKKADSVAGSNLDQQSQEEKDGDIKFQETYNEFCQADGLQESIDYESKYNFQEKVVPTRVVEVTMMPSKDYPQNFIKAQNKRSKEDSLRRFQKTCNDYKVTQPFGSPTNELDRRVEKLVDEMKKGANKYERYL